ncbi:hypothetical protein [Ovoidimarina sediminis]|uniref:hypothetical protein n=1 Tax=Ovoidimarina sediminis TaxID=3079856 RepID=UPI00290A7738|nr:hypothetical protein [Rhodophyticola sp. MJ-SS7]MDU8945831.1 hypothetical protein [Rhodophyticola sp. MJ-SS7]
MKDIQTPANKNALPPIGTLWIGGSLTWLEQLCLTSFVANGHPTTLFTYSKVTGVPEGVNVSDGRDILDTEQFVTHARSESVALFSDLFRFHMVRKRPGMIWVDTDIYCHRPIDFEEEYLFGYERYRSDARNQVNGAVLRLPQGSEALASMISFMEEPHPIPDWLPPRHLAPILERKNAGNPMHVSEMIWGIWGPVGFTAHLRMSGEISHAKPIDVFYPVPFADRTVFFRRPAIAGRYLTEETRTIHLWAPIKKRAARKHDGLCRPGSFLAGLLKKHGIDDAAAPIPVTRAREVVA